MTQKRTPSTFICQHCQAQYPKWQGRCTSCQTWHSVAAQTSSNGIRTSLQPWHGAVSEPKLLSEIELASQARVLSADAELNRVLGGGIVPGSLVLIGGEPGIGKSTLLLQVATALPAGNVLYVSGEESQAQIKLRADRLGASCGRCYVLNETDVSHILTQIEQIGPTLVIIDSIQTLCDPNTDSTSGSLTQVRACSAQLLQCAKTRGIPIFLIGHITKEGQIAGPKVLEHMVDTVLQFEGDPHTMYRIVRATKNRFGATSELGIYEMKHDGLHGVDNPSRLSVSERDVPLSGIAVGVSVEGNRSILIELQALVSPAAYGTPQRSATGFDAKRLNMLLAVLEKRAQLRLGTQDVFLNVTGGLTVTDPALDLAACVAVVSSLRNAVVPDQCCFIGEVGLGGETRRVGRAAQRIQEAHKRGLSRVFIAQDTREEAQTKAASTKAVADVVSLLKVLWT